ncbi:MAG: contractile injection system protein, VgrG/Pvc8 family, partial [Minicystis sp.]
MINQAGLVLEGLEGAKIVRVTGREAMNELGGFLVDVLAPDADLDPASLIDRGAILALAGAAGELTEHHLFVLGAAHQGHFRGEARARLTLAPLAARLSLRVTHAVFQEKTTQEIVHELLERAGLPARLVKWRLAGQYAKRAYSVQYGESDWAFLARLLAEEGINTWFDRQGDDSFLVFGDHPSSHDSIEGDSPLVPF